MIREFLGFFITGFLLVLELALVFGMLLVVLSLPYAIAIYQFEAMPGSTETAWALTIGLMLMGVWAMFLLKGGRLKIRQGFEAMKQLSLKALGSAKR